MRRRVRAGLSTKAPTGYAAPGSRHDVRAARHYRRRRLGNGARTIAAAGGRETLLWAREPEVVAGINDRHENAAFLAASPLDLAVRATGDLLDLKQCGAWLVVTPAQHMRSILEQAHVSECHCCCVRRVSRNGAASSSTMSPAMSARIRRSQSSLVRPLRTKSPRACRRLSPLPPTIRARRAAAGADRASGLPNLRLQRCRRCGNRRSRQERAGNRLRRREGRGLGQNARAALIARGFAEMTRFGLARGAKRETLAGLSGFGDLVLTCSSTNSRNYSLGKGIGEGRSAAELLADQRTVAEGAFTAPGACADRRAGRHRHADRPGRRGADRRAQHRRFGA